MDCIKANFDKVLHALKLVLRDRLPAHDNFLPLRPGPRTKFTDIEVIALSLTAESMQIDSENLLFMKLNSRYKKDFPHLISRRQYNDRRKALNLYTEEIRSLMSAQLNEFQEISVVDSMPLIVCKKARMFRNKLGKENESTTPDVGTCPSKQESYYGYKLHIVCSSIGVIQVFDITKASVHDVNYLKDVRYCLKNILLAGDRGYIGESIKQDLWATSKICLETPYRSNQKNKPLMMKELFVIRKRIETLFSQLNDHLRINHNYAKSFLGYITRLLSKITTMTMLQYYNRFVNGKPISEINKVKYALL